ncbi:MAG: hypothetical protein RLY86_3292 [Pseudomonadota bacterium]
MARTARNQKIDTRTARAKLAERREPYWTVITKGGALGYRKGAKGGTWVARWRTTDGSQVYEALGPADDFTEGKAVLTYQQATEKARAWFESKAGTIGPVRSNEPITVRVACRRYVSYLTAKNRRSGKDAEQRLTKHVPDRMADTLVNDLTLPDLEEWHRGMVRHDDDDPDLERRSKDTANRVLNYLKAALNRLLQDRHSGVTDDRAWRHLKPFQKVGEARAVFLDPAQCTRLLNGSSGSFRALVTGALLTGCRAGELKGMRVRDFAPSSGLVHVRDGKTGPRDVYLTAEGLAFFASLTAGREADALIFSRDDGSPWGKDDHILPMREAAAVAKLPGDTVFYSLRHTYASQSLMAGMGPQLLAENMGTSVRMIELHYGKFTSAARRQMIEAAAPKLGLTVGNVVPITG